jgi:hypothetical protein
MLARLLGESILVHPQEGGAIAASRVVERDHPLPWVLRYELPEGVDVVAVRHRPEAMEGAVAVPRQIQLSVAMGRADPRRMIRLTTAGNHEVVFRPSDDPRSPAGDPLAPARLTEPFVRIDAAPPDVPVVAAIEYPATLLATWGDLLPLDGAMLDPAALPDRRGAIEGWALARLVLPPGVEPDAVRVQLIDPFDRKIRGADRVSALTTRVRIELSLPSVDRLEWRGFNDAVLRVNVEQRDRGVSPAAWRPIGSLNPSTTVIRLDLADARGTRVAPAGGR